MSLVHAEGVHRATFRCKNCGHLVASDHAGERDWPLACPVCKAGVRHGVSLAALRKDFPDMFVGLTAADLKDVKEGGRVGQLPFNMVWFADHANWEHLADMSEDELKVHGLTPDQVCKHVPCAKGEQGGTHHARVVGDGSTASDAGEMKKN